MSKLSIVCSILAVVALGCGDKKSAPPSAKPAEPAAAPDAAVAPAVGGAKTLGPIDLSKATIDLAALFPGATYVLHKADDQTGAGSTPDGYEIDTAEINRGKDALVQAELDGDRITKLTVYDPTLATPAGAHAGLTAAQVTKLVPDAMCISDKWGVSCGSPKDQTIEYVFAEGGLPGEWGEDHAIAEVNGDAELTSIDWLPAEAARPKLAALPTVIAANDIDDADEGALDEEEGDGPIVKPTADQVDRCARLYAITSKCGVTSDFEFGWMKSDQKPVSPAAAKKACDVPSMTPVEGISPMPAPALEPGPLGKVEAASKKGCKAVLAALDEVDPRISPAGSAP